MPHQHRPADLELVEGFVQQLGLLEGRPGAPARPLAVAEAGPVEDHDTAGPEQPLGDAAGVVVVPSHGIAMNEKDGPPRASVAVVQPHAVHLKEGTPGRVAPLRAACGEMVRDRQDEEDRKGEQDALPRPRVLHASERIHGSDSIRCDPSRSRNPPQIRGRRSSCCNAAKGRSASTQTTHYRPM
jgi:hypothetical protein